jgi:cell division FtsZ-interacting protein ZapD
MSAIMRIRQARNPEQLASEIEPLAQSLATLADESRQVMDEQKKAVQKQVEQQAEQIASWQKRQAAAVAALEAAAADLKAQASKAQKAHQENSEYLKNSLWWAVLIAILTSMVAALATTAFWLWLAPPKVENYLDSQEMVDLLAPYIQAQTRAQAQPKPSGETPKKGKR